MSQEAANKLEAWFGSLPGIVQSTLHEPFTWLNESLKAVSGDPQALLAAGPQYVRIASTITTIAQDQIRDRDELAPRWNGDAYDAFSATVDLIDSQLQQLSAALGNVPAFLDSAAQACVESANMIIDLVTSLIMFAISMLVVNLALSIVTFGASAAVAIAGVLARAAQVASEVASVVSRLSEVLAKVAEILRKLQAILQKIVTLLKRLEQVLAEAKSAAKAAKGVDKVRKQAAFMGKNALTGNAVKLGTAGLVAPPTTGSAAKDAGVDYFKGFNDATDAVDVNR